MSRLKGQFLVVGDVNLPGINWENNTSTVKGWDFLEVVESRFMTQHVNISTHNSGNILDLVISSRANMVGEVYTEGKLGSSDHDILSFIVEVETMETENMTKKRNYNKADWEKMKTKLDID